MVHPDKQALAIYDLMFSTSGDRPYSGSTVDELTRKITEWQKGNPALTILRESDSAVHLAFLKHSCEWLRANGDLRGNFQLCQTLSDGISLSLRALTQSLPSDLLLSLVSQYRQDGFTARLYFPFDLLLSSLTREQITEEVRTELRKVHLQLAPSPNGKFEPGAKATRDRIDDLTYTEGQKQLDPGLGPWSQIVFDEIRQKEPITRSGWIALLDHFKSLKPSSPNGKWKKTARELINALGESEVATLLFRWARLGPTPGQPAEAPSPIEDSQYQKGLIWCLASMQNAEVPVILADFGIACLRKIRMFGAVSQKVGLACIQALGSMASRDSVAQLTRMRAKVKYSTARRLIDKSLQLAAEKTGVTPDELQDSAVETYGLDERGAVRFDLGEMQATVQLLEDATVAVVWRNEEGKIFKAVPTSVKKNFPAEVRSISTLAKNLEQACRSQKIRLENSLVLVREMPLTHWRRYFVEHPILGFLGRRLIWVFRDSHGSEQAAMSLGGQMCNSSGNPLDVSAFDKVRLWHPLSSVPLEVHRWRELVCKNNIRQPFKQAFREFYVVTDDERETRLYSNRFAGVFMHQHQLASLCIEREWNYRLMGAGFDGANVPTKHFNSWRIHAEFYVDLPSDRNPSLLNSALGEESPTGINLFVGSDQVRFYRDKREIAVDEVPALVYSEIMRDVDLFTSVCALGGDESWSDQGDRGVGIMANRLDMHEVSSITALRADLLSRVLPHTPIADRCRLGKYSLEVRGQLGTYQIQLVWGRAALLTDSRPRWLKIPQKLLSAVELNTQNFPVELDHRTESILRKAYVLANDWEINSPDFVRQLSPD